MGAMVRAALLLCLLSTSAGAARINVMFAHDAPANGILLDEAGLAPPQKPGWDRPSTAESSALLDTTGMYGDIPLDIPLHKTGIKCEGNKHWETGVRWTTGLSLGHGSNGKIIQVSASNSNKSKQYAIKMPIVANRTSAEDIDNEATIMQATTAFFRTGHHPECQHVAPVLDSRPCLDGVLLLTGAYVTLKMEMDLHKWYVNYAQDFSDVRKERQGTIARQLADGLSCLHTAGARGFMHGDFKMDNVLIESIDTETRCPRGLRVIDFGLSHELGSAVNKYGEKHFEESVHLPDTLFEDAPDSLSLTLESDPDMFYASSDVDWCSYAFLMNTKFRYNPIQEAFDIARVISCGKMGYGRRLVSRQGPLQEGGMDVEGGKDVQVDSRASLATWRSSEARSPATTVPSAVATRKRQREEAEQVEPSHSAAMHLMNFAERIRSRAG